MKKAASDACDPFSNHNNLHHKQQHKFIEERSAGYGFRNFAESASQYGFPMLVSCYLLVRMEGKIDQLSKNIDALTRVIASSKA
ncbi:MAG: YvrJ family protein [Phascolarctobacterium sp.]